MAKIANIGLILIIASLFLLAPNNVYARKQGSAAEELTFLHDGCLGKEKVAKLEIYVHDLRVGNPTPTVYEVAAASITPNSPTSFGSIHVADDLVTSGPDINSAAVGRIQGLTTSADLAVNAVALNLNIVFTAGRVNGSTISILGRNQVSDAQRELAVAGGTGVFRFARGYAIQTTTYYDAATFYGVFKYTIYTTYQGLKLAESDGVVVEIAQM